MLYLYKYIRLDFLQGETGIMPHKNKSVFTRVLKTVLCIFLCLLILVVGAFAALVCYERTKSFTTTDFDSYLKNGTYLEDTAIAVLPSKEDLDTKEIVFYEYEYDYSVILSGNSMLRLVVIYDADDFNTAWQTLEKQYLMQDEGWRERFYFDGDLYHCYIFYGEAHREASDRQKYDRSRAIPSACFLPGQKALFRCRYGCLPRGRRGGSPDRNRHGADIHRRRGSHRRRSGQNTDGPFEAHA